MFRFPSRGPHKEWKRTYIFHVHIINPIVRRGTQDESFKLSFAKAATRQHSDVRSFRNKLLCGLHEHCVELLTQSQPSLARVLQFTVVLINLLCDIAAGRQSERL